MEAGCVCLRLKLVLVLNESEGHVKGTDRPHSSAARFQRGSFRSRAAGAAPWWMSSPLPRQLSKLYAFASSERLCSISASGAVSGTLGVSAPQMCRYKDVSEAGRRGLIRRHTERFKSLEAVTVRHDEIQVHS